MQHLAKPYLEKYLSPKNIKYAEEIFGTFQNFEHSKIIHSHSTYLNNGNLYQIHNHIQSPKCYEDMWAFHFLRAYAWCSLTSGKILRLEHNPFSEEVY